MRVWKRKDIKKIFQTEVCWNDLIKWRCLNMSKEEINLKDNRREFLDNLIGALNRDPVAIKNLNIQIINAPTLIRDTLYWYKFKLFSEGIKKAEDDLEKSVKLSNKLFGNAKDKQQNGMRLLEYIDRADSEQKIDYYVNATRSLLMALINNEEYFRIMKAISETLNEDLEYLSKIEINSNPIKGNIQLLALERSGLVLQAGMDANEGIESQNYVVSSLGRMVDRYAISLGKENRQSLYNKEVKQKKLEVTPLEITKEEIDEICV